MKLYDDPTREDARTMLSDVCFAMHDQHAAEFSVSGFGDERWPVDVGTDMCVFFEQVPRALRRIEERSPFTIDFYEQGIERCLEFEPDGASYLVRCSCRLKWQPSPAHEVIDSKQLATMLRESLEDFEASVAKSSPRIAAHPWFRDWFTGTVAP